MFEAQLSQNLTTSVQYEQPRQMILFYLAMRAANDRKS
jgi:hypothetical protein